MDPCNIPIHFFTRTGLKRFSPFLFLLLFAFNSFAQKKPSGDDLIIKGTALYTLQLASWTATDNFYDYEYDRVVHPAGSITYKDKDSIRTVFYVQNDTSIKALTKEDSIEQSKKKKELLSAAYMMSFKLSNVSKDAIRVQDSMRTLTDYEKKLIALRNKIYDDIDKDTSFYHEYADTKLSAIIYDTGKDFEVYILSTTAKTDFVPMGNDYYLRFKRDGTQISREKIHPNLIMVPTKYVPRRDRLNEVIKSSYHYHTGGMTDLITATDVCNLLLYKKFIKWEKHEVIGRNLVSMYSMKDRRLYFMTKEEYHKQAKKSEEEELYEYKKPVKKDEGEGEEKKK